MELFRFKRDIPFMKYGKLTTFISLATFILAVFFLATKGLNYSVEFTGGTVMEVEYAQGAEVDKVRDSLNSLKLGEIQVQALGTNKHLMIRLPNRSMEITIASVEPWVMTVRLMVAVMALSMTSGTVWLRIAPLRKFSRIRSNTTTDSFTE